MFYLTLTIGEMFMEWYVKVILFGYFIICCFIADICKDVAKYKGHENYSIYATYGFFLNVVGIFIVIALPDLNMQKKLDEQNKMLKLVFDRLDSKDAVSLNETNKTGVL
jgi:hypothetical protein